MTDRDNPGGGGLTGATGDLTPESTDQAFDPGERRAAPGASDQATGSSEGETRIDGDERADSEGRC